MFDISKIIKSIIPPSVRILIVTKNRKPSEIRYYLEKGYYHFGESKVIEAYQKWQILKQDFPDIKLHMIGHLQSNKIKKALELFDVIETLDSFEKARLIAHKKKHIQREISFYIQVNIGNEDQKHGIPINQAKELVDFCRIELELNVTGLMCIPPQNIDPMPYFNQMKICADECNVENLSMGMSNDFQQAIQAGSTEIRLGRILFEDIS